MKSTAHLFEQKDLSYKKRGKETSLKDNKDIMASSESTSQEPQKFNVLGKIRGWIKSQKKITKNAEHCFIKDGENEEERNIKDEEYRIAGLHPWYNERFYLKYHYSGEGAFDLKEVQIAFSQKGFLLVKELKKFVKSLYSGHEWTNQRLLHFFSFVRIAFYNGEERDFYVSSGATKDGLLLTIQNVREETETVFHHLGISKHSRYRDNIIGSLSLLVPSEKPNVFSHL